MPEHASRSTAAEAPYLESFKAMDMDERWLNRSPLTMLETFHWFRGESFHLIIEDLLRLPVGTRVVVEGFRLLPHLVKPLLAEAHHAVWLLPTPQFREAALDKRGSTWTIPNRTSDPQRARTNLDERERLFTARLAEQTARLDLPVIRLKSGGVSENELVDQVEGLFRLPTT